MFILRRNKDNEIVCEQAGCPSPEQIVTAVNADMTWRCNAHSETIPFMEATNKALVLMREARPAQMVYLNQDGLPTAIMIPADLEIETLVIKYCGEYYQHARSHYNSRPYFATVELYDTGIG